MCVLCIHLEGVPEVTLRCRAKNKTEKTRHVLYNGYHFDPYTVRAGTSGDSGVGEGASSRVELSDVKKDDLPTGPPIEDTSVSEVSSDEGVKSEGKDSDQDSGADMEEVKLASTDPLVRKMIDDVLPKACPCDTKRLQSDRW